MSIPSQLKSTDGDGTADEPIDSGPRLPRTREILPILVLVGLSQVSVLVSDSLQNWPCFWVSTVMLLSLPIFFWNRYPTSVLAPAAIYLLSAILLNVSSEPHAGLTLLLLLPVCGVALFGTRSQSTFIVIAAVAGSALISYTNHLDAAAIARQTTIYLGVSAVLASSIISLRDRLVHSKERTTLLLHNSQILNRTTERLAILTRPSEIAQMACEFGAKIGSPIDTVGRGRAVYYRIADSALLVEAEFDELAAGETSNPVDDGRWSASDRCSAARALESGGVLSGPIGNANSDPTVIQFPVGSTVTHGAWIPIAPNGRAHGVLSVLTRGVPVPESSIGQLAALGRVTELALSNWNAHETLEEAARQEDRRRIARDLHDGLAQELAFIASRTVVGNSSESASQSTRALADAADRALDEARRAIVVLSEEMEPLHISIGQTVEDLATRHGLGVRLKLTEAIELEGEITENLLRIVREAITNAARHGHASTVSVAMNCTNGEVRLVVADNGSGFLQDDQTAPRGYGLTFMHERCAQIGGQLDITSKLGLGTRVEVVVPS